MRGAPAAALTEVICAPAFQVRIHWLVTSGRCCGMREFIGESLFSEFIGESLVGGMRTPFVSWEGNTPSVTLSRSACRNGNTFRSADASFTKTTRVTNETLSIMLISPL